MLLRCDEGDTASLSGESEAQLIDQLQRLAPSCAAVLVSDYDYGILTERVVQTLCQLQADQGLLLRFQAAAALQTVPAYRSQTQL